MHSSIYKAHCIYKSSIVKILVDAFKIVSVVFNCNRMRCFYIGLSCEPLYNFKKKQKYENKIVSPNVCRCFNI
mgnify:CR=1 FL=1